MEKSTGVNGWKTMLDKYRKKADWILQPLAVRVNMTPNALSAFSLLFAAFAGICLYFSYEHTLLLLVAPFLILANGVFDALDGKVARLKKKESLKGDFIEHSIDRIADFFMIGGLGVSLWCTPLVGVTAVAAVFLTSYMGTQAHAVGHGREYGGILGRADRVAILFCAPFIQYFLLQVDVELLNWSFLQWVMIFFAVIGIITATQRFFIVLRWFNDKNKEKQ
jgi:phosphatidylglycerophosphate synthase